MKLGVFSVFPREVRDSVSAAFYLSCMQNASICLRSFLEAPQSLCHELEFWLDLVILFTCRQYIVIILCPRGLFVLSH